MADQEKVRLADSMRTAWGEFFRTGNFPPNTILDRNSITDNKVNLIDMVPPMYKQKETFQKECTVLDTALCGNYNDADRQRSFDSCPSTVKPTWFGPGTPRSDTTLEITTTGPPLPQSALRPNNNTMPNARQFLAVVDLANINVSPPLDRCDINEDLCVKCEKDRMYGSIKQQAIGGNVDELYNIAYFNNVKQSNCFSNLFFNKREQRFEFDIALGDCSMTSAIVRTNDQR